MDYEIEGFLEKNKDSLPDAVVAAVKFSSLRLIRTLFMRPPGAASQLRKSIMKKRCVGNVHTVHRTISTIVVPFAWDTVHKYVNCIIYVGCFSTAFNINHVAWDSHYCDAVLHGILYTHHL